MGFAPLLTVAALLAGDVDLSRLTPSEVKDRAEAAFADGVRHRDENPHLVEGERVDHGTYSPRINGTDGFYHNLADCHDVSLAPNFCASEFSALNPCDFGRV